MTNRLEELDGNYRFIIPDDQSGLIIGPGVPNHKILAQRMNLDTNQVKGGTVEIWDRGKKLAFTGGSLTVPAATEEDFEAAKQIGVTIFEYQSR